MCLGGLMDMTADSDSANTGSIPVRDAIIFFGGGNNVKNHVIQFKQHRRTVVATARHGDVR